MRKLKNAAQNTVILAALDKIENTLYSYYGLEGSL